MRALWVGLIVVSALGGAGAGFPEGSDDPGYRLDEGYNRNLPPGKNTSVSVSVFIERVSAVDESKEELSLDLFLRVRWRDRRMRPAPELEHADLAWERGRSFWMPDLHIRQLREMRTASPFRETASLRLYRNGTLALSIGATIVVRCDMDFALYPLDVQICPVDFGSYKYTTEDVTFRWAGTEPVRFGDGHRPPEYAVSFAADREVREVRDVHYGEGDRSTARLVVTVSRKLRGHMLECYLPSTLFVVMSWGGFCVVPEIVPGRMVLLVTTLLSLVTMIETVRNNSPDATELKCVEVWLISCTLFVFLALIEYFAVLFGIRYEKHWARDGPEKVGPETDAPAPPPSRRPPEAETRLGRAVLRCGSRRGTADRISLVLFPACFALFSGAYWTVYLNASERRAHGGSQSS